MTVQDFRVNYGLKNKLLCGGKSNHMITASQHFVAINLIPVRNYPLYQVSLYQLKLRHKIVGQPEIEVDQ